MGVLSMTFKLLSCWAKQLCKPILLEGSLAWAAPWQDGPARPEVVRMAWVAVRSCPMWGDRSRSAALVPLQVGVCSAKSGAAPLPERGEAPTHPLTHPPTQLTHHHH